MFLPLFIASDHFCHKIFFSLILKAHINRNFVFINSLNSLELKYSAIYFQFLEQFTFNFAKHSLTGSYQFYSCFATERNVVHVIWTLCGDNFCFVVINFELSQLFACAKRELIQFLLSCYVFLYIYRAFNESCMEAFWWRGNFTRKLRRNTTKFSFWGEFVEIYLKFRRCGGIF